MNDMKVDSLFPIVGVGASAGGLEALSELLAHLPADSGMAFVVVQHLDPTHDSGLRDILAKATLMSVQEAEHELPVLPDHVYIIPPNTSMTIAGGALQLAPRADTRSGPHLPIDQFFTSLAGDRQAGAIGVILSGNGSDGTLGLEEIKAAGGITFAQDEHSARYTSMPLSAERSGCVDFVLPPAAIAHELARVGIHPYLGPAQTTDAIPDPAAEQEHLQAILALLRASLGVDFSAYRETTIHRRIMRRMVLHNRESLAEYVEHLRGDRAEVDALYQDLLINVTRFFREPETFEVLKQKVFPEILKAREGATPVRVWVPGCSTGQEVYSLAMALLECCGDEASIPTIQIFATDLSETVSLQKAREGRYPESIEAEVSAEQLARFFTREDGRYRIKKAVRDMCVFAKQNVVEDAPFSRVDLISCRNLLIYFAPSQQRRVIPTFHYALNPHGFLLLGAAETVGPFLDLFEAVDHQHRIYRKRPAVVGQNVHLRREALRHGTAGAVSAWRTTAVAADWQREADRLVLGHYAPAGVLVNDNLDVLQFRGHTSPYLAPAPGEANFNVLKMAREGLFLELRSALAECRQRNAAVRRQRLRVRGDARVREIELRVLPVKLPGTQERCFLILFDEEIPAAAPDAGTAQPSGAARRETMSWLPPWLRRRVVPVAAAATPRPPAAADDSDLEQLRQELTSTREYLQSVVEQQNITNEELMAANEEILSANEELQSTNEELGTAKEELQSLNEELITVNEQLRHGNAELSHLNDDFVNLLGSADVPMLAVDGDLRIRRFTPAAERLLQLLPADIGRQISTFRLPFEVPDLEQLIAQTVASVQVAEREVRDTAGRWYALRVHPYLTADRRIDGALVVLLDIQEVKQAQEALREARDHVRSIIETARDPLLVLDGEIRIELANEAFHRTFELSAEEAQGQSLYSLRDGEWDLPELRLLLEQVLPRETSFQDFEVRTDGGASGGRRVMLLNARPILRAGRDTRLILLAIEDITVRSKMESDLRLLAEELSDADERKNQFLATLAHELRNPLSPMLNALHILKRVDGGEREAMQARDMMERQVQRLVLLIDDLLDIARITRGRIELRRELVDLAAVVRAVVDTCRTSIEEAGHTLTAQLPPAPLLLDADPMRLAQILENLLINAIKYTNRGGRIELSAEQDGGEAVLRVRDSGIGIAPEMLPRIWDLFVQVDSSAERTQQGMGIGLSLARRLVQIHGGSIEARSAGLGHGSELTVRLPLASSQHSAADAAPLDAADEPAAPVAPRTILVVDDNVDAADSLAMLLRLMGHTVHVAYDGPSALDEASANRPGIVFLDIGLPGMNGYEVATKLRQDLALGESFLVALTGYGTDEDRRRSRAAGFDAHLVKPLQREALDKLMSGEEPRAGAQAS